MSRVSTVCSLFSKDRTVSLNKPNLYLSNYTFSVLKSRFLHISILPNTQVLRLAHIDDERREERTI